MKIFLLLVTLLCSEIVFSQLLVATNDRGEATWNAKNESWDFHEQEPISTFFEFNKELSAFKATSLENTAGYLISKWDFDEKLSKYIMNVQTKNGKTYELIVDGTGGFVAFFYWKNEMYYMKRYAISKSDFGK